ncbi:MAG: glycosyltransferase family 4 protein [Candidatus Micrarchaeota archaeon]
MSQFPQKRKMHIAMLGWEFPPFVSGGLGVHCYELTKCLTKLGVEVDFYMPRTGKQVDGTEVTVLRMLPDGTVVKVKNQDYGLNVIQVSSISKTGRLSAYPEDSAEYRVQQRKYIEKDTEELSEEVDVGERGLYGLNFMDDVENYNSRCIEVLLKNHKRRNYVLLHNHDWLTVPAAIKIKSLAGIPRVQTIHSTEFDRAPIPWDRIMKMERSGIADANRVIAVSRLTMNQIAENYGADKLKIRVVYNGVDPSKFDKRDPNNPSRIVLFLGRLTEQKGPFHFLWTAKRVLEKEKNVRFLIVGEGALLPFLIQETFKLGIQDNVIFTGYIPADQLKKVYSKSDIYVMPSLSEPFGITALEAMCSGTPVVLSKNSGVGEATKHNLQADFWNIDAMAEYIIALLKYPALSNTLTRNELIEVKKFTWEKCAAKTFSVYKEVAKA